MPQRSDRRAVADRHPSRPVKADRRLARQRAGLQAKLADADRLVAKRTAQLGSASAKRAALMAKLADLPEHGAAAAPRPTAYCLKDRRRVAMVEVQPLVLSDGRHALGGTCEVCGSRIVRFGG